MNIKLLNMEIVKFKIKVKHKTQKNNCKILEVLLKIQMIILK